ncbi:hypothetical protein FRC02_002385 [Tulasnella sp. 418]|nr:hypothetical protein FRC02_002385 [Tulasnella sp. 418]
MFLKKLLVLLNIFQPSSDQENVESKQRDDAEKLHSSRDLLESKGICIRLKTSEYALRLSIDIIPLEELFRRDKLPNVSHKAVSRRWTREVNPRLQLRSTSR